MKKVLSLIFLVSIFIFFQACTSDGDGTEPTPDNPIPTLTSITPTSKVSHMPSFTLTATGTNFVSTSMIVFNGVQKQANYVSSTELTCQIDPDDTVVSSLLALSNMGGPEILSETVLVLVRNPSPGGGDSNSLDFTINDNHTFYVPNNISNNSARSYHPEMAIDSTGNINVVWHDETPGNYDIYFSRSTDNGARWSQAVNISNNSATSYYSAIAVDSNGNINVVWHDYTPGNWDIYFSRSTDNGTTWTQAVNISNNPKNSYHPQIAVDSAGNINVVWYDFTPGKTDIYFSRSTDSGVSWSQAANISNNVDYSDHSNISVDSSGNINVVWQDRTPGKYDIYFSRSTDSGSTWSQAVNISNNPEHSYRPVIGVDTGGSINVVWYDYTPGKTDIYFSHSTDNGAVWSQAVNISNNSEWSYHPSISVDSAGNINVVWHDLTPGNYDILFSRSTDNGTTWSQAANISNNSANSYYPDIRVDGSGNINIVWHDYTPGNYDIYFTGSTR